MADSVRWLSQSDFRNFTRIEVEFYQQLLLNSLETVSLARGGRNRIGRWEKWPKKSWEEGEIWGKSREGEKET